MSERTAPWTPLGVALLDHLEGEPDAIAAVVHEDGDRESLAAGLFFRPPEGFSGPESAAVELCRGRVLDLGAGAGCHALALQERGLEVVAVDVGPLAVEVMRRRGVKDARVGDAFSPEVFQEDGGGPFDTLVLLMNGIGVAGDLEGLDRFLARAHLLLAEGGHLLCDSTDPRRADHPGERRRQEERIRRGRYRGESVQQLAYRGLHGAPFGWLYLDPPTLRRHAHRQGWRAQVVYEDEEGAYLARLTR